MNRHETQLEREEERRRKELRLFLKRGQQNVSGLETLRKAGRTGRTSRGSAVVHKSYRRDFSGRSRSLKMITFFFRIPCRIQERSKHWRLRKTASMLVVNS